MPAAFRAPFRLTPELVKASPEWVRVGQQLDRNFDEIKFPGGYAATVTVAASDAADTSKAAADFVCDGTNDEADINEALEVCHALAVTAGYGATDGNVPGGRVLLSEGTFQFTGDGMYQSDVGPANTSLQGQGWGATRIKHSQAAGVYYKYAIQTFGPGFALSDLTIDTSGVPRGGYGVFLRGGKSITRNVRFLNLGYSGLRLDGDDCVVSSCEFRPNADVNTSYAIEVVSGAGVNISDCLFVDTPYDAIWAASGDRVMLTSNRIIRSNTAAAGTDAVTVGANSVVLGNVLEGSAAIATINAGLGSQVANNVLL